MPRAGGKIDTERGRAPPEMRQAKQKNKNKPTNTKGINKNRLGTHQDKHDIFHNDRKHGK